MPMRLPVLVRLSLRDTTVPATLPAVLQCSGNGRTYFSKAAPAKGAPWTTGAMANVRFSGVPLAKLLDEKLDVELDWERAKSAFYRDDSARKEKVGWVTEALAAYPRARPGEISGDTKDGIMASAKASSDVAHPCSPARGLRTRI